MSTSQDSTFSRVMRLFLAILFASGIYALLELTGKLPVPDTAVRALIYVAFASLYLALWEFRHEIGRWISSRARP